MCESECVRLFVCVCACIYMYIVTCVRAGGVGVKVSVCVCGVCVCACFDQIPVCKSCSKSYVPGIVSLMSVQLQ